MDKRYFNDYKLINPDVSTRTCIPSGSLQGHAALIEHNISHTMRITIILIVI